MLLRGRRTARLRIMVAVAASVGLIGAGSGAAAAAQAPGRVADDAFVSDPASLVDPLIGTGSGGATVGQVDTFPGASAPFGMLTFSPDTPARPDGGGYDYADSATTGFSLTHMSGPGCGAFGDVPILPTVGPVGPAPAGASDQFSHADEHAAPGRYAVTLGPAGIGTQLAVTARTGLSRFSYPATAEANVLVKVADSANPATTSSVRVVGRDQLTGRASRSPASI